MSLGIWILTGVVLSYIISCYRDLGPYRKEYENLPIVLCRCWLAFILSIICRVIVIAIVFHIEVALLQKVVGDINSFERMYCYLGTLLSLSFISALLCVLPVDFLKNYAIKRAQENLHQANGQPRLQLWVKNIQKIEGLCWSRIRADLEFLRAEQTNRLWRNPDNRPLVFELYEDNKLTIIEYHFKYRNRPEIGISTWLYLGILAGNNNSKRAEALINCYGVSWLKNNVNNLRDGVIETKIPTRQDLRDMKPEHIRNPPLDTWMNSKRACDFKLAELYLSINPEAALLANQTA